jgi:DNA polymerase
VFAKSDAGQSEDIYCVTASDLVGFEVKKAEHSHERQLGKITVLGCGYQMGSSKLQYQAEKDYGVVLEDHEAEHMVNVYRDKYQEVKWLWYGLQDAAIAAVKTGQPHSYNNIIYELVDDNAGRWLACVLPNGRRIWYYEPIVERIVPPWGGAKRDSLTYMGRDNKKGGSWGRVRTYGGMLCENVVQAIARDLMAEAMVRVEIAGYNIVLTVHDEIISEDDENFGNQTEFEELMAVCPPWARGCPIAVEGGTVTRYQKV